MMRAWRVGVAGAAALVVCATGTARVSAVAADAGAEAKTAAAFEALRPFPPEQFEFLHRMPKGGDLHNHLSGAVYAESYVRWAGEAGLCVSLPAAVLSPPPCDAAARPPVSVAAASSVMLRQMLSGWSMLDWAHSGQSGHDHFFDTFGKFGAASTGRAGDMLAEVVERAAEGHVEYMELMLTPDNGRSSQIGARVGWNGDADATRLALESNGIADAATQATASLDAAEGAKDAILACGTPRARPGCGVTLRYVFQVTRVAPLGPVFAQMVTGFALADRADSKVVALNLVAPEDDPASMRNFAVEMQMLHALRPHYPHAHLTLHAGELAPGLVPPDGLDFHIHDSIEVAGAERIGHGVDILHETNALDLLKTMAAHRVMVEICLTSNDVILGVRGPDHPLATYLRYGVPVALATDDEGVSRSEMTREYLEAAEDQHLGYLELKTMARTSLEFAFVGGASFWSDARRTVPAAPCAAEWRARSAASAACEQWLSVNEKARLQWRLERDFVAFEASVSAAGRR